SSRPGAAGAAPAVAAARASSVWRPSSGTAAAGLPTPEASSEPTPGDVLRLLLLLAFVACDSKDPVDTDPEPPPACGTAHGSLSEDLVVLAWDDGIPATSLDEQSWGFTDYAGQSRVIAQEVAHEAVRFELDRPSRV